MVVICSSLRFFLSSSGGLFHSPNVSLPSFMTGSVSLNLENSLVSIGMF